MRRIVVAAVIALLATACGGGTTRSTDPQPLSEPATAEEQLDQLAAARSRWAAGAPEDYTVSQLDRCPDCPAESATLAVRAGEVVSLASTETETIEDVFTTIERSIRDGADVDVEYHPELGHPIRVVIDLDGDGTPDVDLEFGDVEAMPIVASLGELLEARRRWEAQNLTSYRYIFRADCTCPDGGTFEVVVVDGRVDSMRPLDDAAHASTLSPGPLGDAFDDLEQWFVDSTELMEEGILEVDVRMDPEYGYPRWFRVVARDIDGRHFAGEFEIVVTVDLVDTDDPVAPPTTVGDGDLAALEVAMEQWESAAIRDYDYVVTLHCECAEETSGPFEITVRSGEAVGAIHRTLGTEVTANLVTFDDLFAAIGLAIVDGNDVDVDYDPNLGHPTWVVLDPEDVARDAGFAISITEFAPLP